MYNKALEIFQQFGPRHLVPIHQRWLEEFPHAGRDDMHGWEKLFRGVEEFAYDVAEQVRDNPLDEHTAVSQISERFPRLSCDRAATYNQARYFSMK
jgi:hypothetical protein